MKAKNQSELHPSERPTWRNTFRIKFSYCPVFWIVLVAITGIGQASAQNQVLLMSDLHFNPLASCDLARKLAQADPIKPKGSSSAESWKDILDREPQKYSKYTEDTNFALLQWSLTAMQSESPHPLLVMITGDLLVHQFWDKFHECFGGNSTKKEFSAFVRKTMTFLADQIGLTFPNAPIIPALGNNDSDCGDYMIDPGGPFLRTFAKSWSKLVHRPPSRWNIKSDFKNMAANAGYYTATILTPRKTHIMMIVTNTTVWPSRYDPACDHSNSDPRIGQLDWLRSTLEQARASHQQVWILGHIPPGIDVFATLRTSGSHIATMYDEGYNLAVISAIHDYGPTVKIGFFGHSHNDDFRLLDAGTRNTPLQLIPSISPIHGNNPAFAVLTVDDDLDPQNYTVYALNLDAPQQWPKEYDFQTEYDQKGFSGKDLLALSTKVANDNKVRERFAKHFTAGRNGRGGITVQNWRAYWCSLTNLESISYSRCLSGFVVPSQ